MGDDKVRNQINIFGTWLDNVGSEEAFEFCLSPAAERDASVLTGFPSLHPIFSSRVYPDYAGLYEDFDLVLNDGRNIARIARLLGERFREKRIAGMDFLPEFVRRAGREGASLFVICGSEVTRDRLVEWLPSASCKREQLVGTWVPPFLKSVSLDDLRGVIEYIEKTQPDIVIVGIASPKQERIGALLKKHCSGNMSIVCVGGALETAVGAIPIGPQWIRDLGLESFYRFSREPKRLFKRYLVFNLLIFPFGIGAVFSRFFRDEKFGRTRVRE
ncbi:MAG: WecB/TagA/CpsF family glycosyltransferase [Verrucomicrobiota bacterium]